MSMHAAVVRSYDRPPRYEPFDPPVPAGPDEVVIDVLSVGLHPRVRSDASGRHYSSSGSLPMVPGVDGVGRLPDGQRVYFVALDDVRGSMADRAIVDLRRTVALADSADSNKVAAAMNPAMSAWVALRRRVPLRAGQSVLILGATGNAGGMAVQVAKRLGAARVVGAGRNPERLRALPGLGADAVVALNADPSVPAEGLADAAADVDVVLDYLWGQPTATAIMTLLSARKDRSRAMDWIQIGAVAGPTMELPSAALRSANLRIQGNGQGAVSVATYLAELPSLIEEIGAGTIGINVVPVPLADVEAIWDAPDAPGVRIVLNP